MKPVEPGKAILPNPPSSVFHSPPMPPAGPSDGYYPNQGAILSAPPRPPNADAASRYVLPQAPYLPTCPLL